MKIGIVPRIQYYKSSLYITVDKKLIDFLYKLYPNSKIKLLFEKKKVTLDLLILSGGNTLPNLINSRENKFREELDVFYFEFSYIRNIKCIGICHGAQFIASYFNSIITKKKGHVIKGEHDILSKDFFPNLNFKVNSYHDFCIEKLGSNLKTLAITKDKSIEGFMHIKKKIFGIMWHPERYNKIKKIDKFLFNKII